MRGVKSSPSRPHSLLKSAPSLRRMAVATLSTAATEANPWQHPPRSTATRCASAQTLRAAITRYISCPLISVTSWMPPCMLSRKMAPSGVRAYLLSRSLSSMSPTAPSAKFGSDFSDNLQASESRPPAAQSRGSSPSSSTVRQSPIGSLNGISSGMAFDKGHGAISFTFGSSGGICDKGKGRSLADGGGNTCPCVQERGTKRGMSVGQCLVAI